MVEHKNAPRHCLCTEQNLVNGNKGSKEGCGRRNAGPTIFKGNDDSRLTV